MDVTRCKQRQVETFFCQIALEILSIHTIMHYESCLAFINALVDIFQHV